MSFSPLIVSILAVKVNKPGSIKCGASFRKCVKVLIYIIIYTNNKYLKKAGFLTNGECIAEMGKECK